MGFVLPLSHSCPKRRAVLGRTRSIMITYRTLFSTFLRIGVLSFGGPAAQISLMHRTLVDERRWLSDADFLAALSLCMLLPGPEAMQLATWAGWRLKGTRGGLIAGLLFVLPGALVVLFLAALYAEFGQVPVVAALFSGVQAAVVAVVVQAVIRLARRALKGRAHRAAAFLAFAALAGFGLPFPAVIAVAGLYGYLTTQGAAPPFTGPRPWAATGRAVTIWGPVWLLPLAGLVLASPGFYAEVAVFFSKLAVVTFGGAYAVLAWMSQAVVVEKGWLTAPQMMDALGLAETTPGPLILVTEFVAYVAGHQKDGWSGGFWAALITLWMTFVPCFLWIFAAGPWLERITQMPRLSGALQCITAAVVGVIGHLSLWFAAHVVFAQIGRIDLGPFHALWPNIASLRPLPALMALGAAYLLLQRHWPLPVVLALSGMVSAIGAWM